MKPVFRFRKIALQSGTVNVVTTSGGLIVVIYAPYPGDSQEAAVYTFYGRPPLSAHRERESKRSCRPRVK